MPDKVAVKLQYRLYTVDPDFPVFAFTGQNRPRNPMHQLNERSDEIRYMHLHNCVEVTCVSAEKAQLYIENEVCTVHRGDVPFERNAFQTYFS